MRPATLTIILYILFLLTQPCQDVLAARGLVDDEARVAVQMSSPSDCDEKGTGDDCSPFCICSCRTVPAGEHFVTFVPEPKILAPIARKSPICYTNPQTNSFTSTVWQPPKH